MTKLPETLKTIVFKFSPFFLFLSIFKLGGGLHYSMLSPLGEQVFPIAVIGLFIGIGAFLQLILDIPAGYMLDKFGYRKLLAVTSLLFLASALSLTFGLTKTTFFLSLGISTFGWLFFGPGSTAYIIGQADKETVGRFMSAREVFASIGIVLASAALIFAVRFSVPVLGIILSILFATAFVLICLAPKDKNRTESHPHHLPRHRFLKTHLIVEAFRSVGSLTPPSFLLVLSSFSAATFYGIIWFVIPLLIAHAPQGSLLGAGLGVFDFSVVVLGFALGKIVDKYDKKLLVLIGLFVFALAGILLGSNFGLLFLFLGFFATTGDELASLSLWAWLYSIDKEHKHYGLISGTVSLFDDLGWTVGPILAGILYTYLGPSWTIAVGGMFISITLLIALILTHAKKPSVTELHPFRVRHHRHKH